MGTGAGSGPMSRKGVGRALTKAGNHAVVIDKVGGGGST